MQLDTQVHPDFTTTLSTIAYNIEPDSLNAPRDIITGAYLAWLNLKGSAR